MKLGLIGFPLTHSFSPRYIKDIFVKANIDHLHSYNLYPLEHEEQLRNFRVLKLDGFNVTIPYKEKIIPYLDCLSEEAKIIGAVNCVKKEGNQYVGYNTDAYGFEKSLPSPEQYENPIHALILGTGGASKAVQYVLEKKEIPFTLIGRNTTPSYEEINKDTIRMHQLIVNTTPLGMYPDVDTFPSIPYQHLTKKHFLLDLVYNPKKTIFLGIGEAIGCKVQNGLQMLKCQADESLKIWGVILKK